MRVICIDASPGYKDGVIPPFKDGENITVIQSKYHEDNYEDVTYNSGHWNKKRFILLSTIDEAQTTSLTQKHERV